MLIKVREAYSPHMHKFLGYRFKAEGDKETSHPWPDGTCEEVIKWLRERGMTTDNLTWDFGN